MGSGNGGKEGNKDKDLDLVGATHAIHNKRGLEEIPHRLLRLAYEFLVHIEKPLGHHFPNFQGSIGTQRRLFLRSDNLGTVM
eukprot:1362554-Amorphochlora_amoeboformis.AAC.2